MIDTHAHIISDDMDSSASEHNVDCLESIRIVTRCDVPLAIIGQILVFH